MFGRTSLLADVDIHLFDTLLRKCPIASGIYVTDIQADNEPKGRHIDTVECKTGR